MLIVLDDDEAAALRRALLGARGEAPAAVRRLLELMESGGARARSPERNLLEARTLAAMDAAGEHECHSDGCLSDFWSMMEYGVPGIRNLSDADLVHIADVECGSDLEER